MAETAKTKINQTAIINGGKAPSAGDGVLVSYSKQLENFVPKCRLLIFCIKTKKVFKSFPRSTPMTRTSEVPAKKTHFLVNGVAKDISRHHFGAYSATSKITQTKTLANLYSGGPAG